MSELVGVVEDLGGGVLGFFAEPPEQNTVCDVCDETLTDRHFLPRERPILITALVCSECSIVHLVHVGCLVKAFPATRSAVVKTMAQFN